MNEAPHPAAVWFDIYSNILLQLMAQYEDAEISEINRIALEMADNAVNSYRMRFKDKGKA